ncbi:MAG: outer membrane lipoprotein-sorting protein [Spirochaetales bacterium]|nr:outer membrane lipoprotein-sorting protein [Spirochaetales bacterium]
MKKNVFILVLLFILSGCGILFADPLKAPSVKDILSFIDKMYRSDTLYAKMEMEIVSSRWTRVLELDIWTKGKDLTFIRILSPKKEKGISTLKMKNEMWNYLPKINKVIRVPPSMMMDSWMGSDFTNDDLVKEYSLFDDFTYEFTEVADPDEGTLYIKCIPKKDLPIIWDSIVVAVRAEDYIPVWQKYYNEKGELMRILNFTDIRTFDKKKIPSTIEVIPQNEDGQKTIIRYRQVEFDKPISDSVFTLQNLRKVN